MPKGFTLLTLFCLVTPFNVLLGQNTFSSTSDRVVFHTEDIITFWSVFDKTVPNFAAKTFQNEYIDSGSEGLRAFIETRIVNGANLTTAITNNLTYYQSIRQSSLAIDRHRENFYECFRKLEEIYAKAVFPDVYFVIGAKNSGGTAFNGGLVIGAEMFGQPTDSFNPVFDIDYIDEVVAHELVHFQQNYPKDNSLLAQCIREGSADFICELIAGDNIYKEIYEYGEEHAKELWSEFLIEKDNADWRNWLYHTNSKSRPRDLGYWVGYKITKSYYDKMNDKEKAINDILNITDFNDFFEKGGYNPQ